MRSISRVSSRRSQIRAAAWLLATIASVFIAAQNRPAAQQVAAADNQFPKIPLTTGRSTVILTAYDITRIAITNPGIADAVVVQPREILIDGKAPGTVSLTVWGGSHQRPQYDARVEQPI